MSSKGKRLGDRNDGRLIRSLPGFARFIPYIMPTRNDATNFYNESFEVSEADRNLRRWRRDGYKGIGFLHFLIAAYIRCAAMMPGINRFIAGRRIYAREGIDVVMAVRRSVSLDSTETMIKVHFLPTDTVFDVYEKLNEKIEEVRSSDENNSTDAFADAFCRLPRPILRFAIGILKIMDYFGIIPASLLELSPFHGSLIVTDLGSLRIGPVFHHIYNFGNLPVFVSFGAKYHRYELNRRGEMEDNKYIDCRFSLDDRIVDGHYYAQFLQGMRYIFKHPSMLETPPNRVNDDIY